jgi:hypothetical protein
MASAMIGELSERIRALETNRRVHWQRSLPLGVDGLDPLLPEGRLPAGALLEFLVAEAGAGAWTLALALARAVCQAGRGLVITDQDGSLYPPAVWAWGIDLRSTLWVRTSAELVALSALTQALRSPAVGAAIGWFNKITANNYRRLQLAAEKGGGLGLVLRPTTAVASASFAAARLAVSPTASRNGCRRLLIESVRQHGNTSHDRLLLEIDDEAHHVCVLPRMATAAFPARKTAGAS